MSTNRPADSSRGAASSTRACALVTLLLATGCLSQGVGSGAAADRDDTSPGDGRTTAGDSVTGGDSIDTCGCDDANPCTRDTCNGSQCTHTPMTAGVATCVDGVQARVCDGSGALVVESCGARCEELGYNGVTGCSNDSCGCTTLSGACTVGREACVSPDGVTDYRAVCVDTSVLGTSQPMWQLSLCDTVCADLGYGVSVGCTYAPGDATKRVCVCGDACSPACTGSDVCDWSTATCQPSGSSECDLNSDCPSHMICSSHRCLYVDCTSDSDCAYCFRCDGYACVSCGDNPYGGCGC